MIFTSSCSTLVGSSLPIGGGVMRQRPLFSWSLAISRPLSSKVMLTHEPSSFLRGTVKSRSTWKPGQHVEDVATGVAVPVRAREDISPGSVAELGDLACRCPPWRPS